MSDPAVPFELAAMAQAKNYYAWLVERFKPQLKGAVVEHGSGTGLLSAALRRAGIGPLTLTEPDAALAEPLRAQFTADSAVRVVNQTLEAYVAETGEGIADAVISANVLEHVPDDAASLSAAYRLLKPGGHLCLYVPARPELFGSLDRAFHHHRRYRRPELRDKLTAAGFKVITLNYRNFINAPLWFIMGRVLCRSSLNLHSVKRFDRYVFPICRRLEDLIAPPYGSNLIALARKE